MDITGIDINALLHANGRAIDFVIAILNGWKIEEEFGEWYLFNEQYTERIIVCTPSYVCLESDNVSTSVGRGLPLYSSCVNLALALGFNKEINIRLQYGGRPLVVCETQDTFVTVVPTGTISEKDIAKAICLVWIEMKMKGEENE